MKRILAAALSLGIATAAPAAGDAVAPPAPPYGLTLVADDAEPVHLSKASAAPAHAVILVHGLDEPGWIWDDLLPVLFERGYAVALYEYRNDCSPGEAALLLGASLRAWRDRGGERVDIVAHSMGGLVVRDMLTSSACYAGNGTGGEQLPAIDRFIMLGTPNHGAPLARVQVLAEMREQVVRLVLDGETRVDRVEGAGQAARDLLPGSAYLRELNARPLPAHTRITVVAGRILPQQVSCVEDLAGRIDLEAGAFGLRCGLADAIGRAVSRTAAGIGDGVVALDSVRLAGIDDFVIVDADHQSMIHEIIERDGDPPALPIVLERLEKGMEEEVHAEEQRGREAEKR